LCFAISATPPQSAPAGAAALFKGFVPMALRYTPGGGILLVAFDFMNRALAQWV
jgi:hypothetical protein